MPSTNNVSPPAGSTTIDSDLKIEVEILALAALRHIASDIAQRIGALNARRPIVIVREDHLDDINKSRAILIQLKGLEDAINAAKERIPKIPSREVAAEKVTADPTREHRQSIYWRHLYPAQQRLFSQLPIYWLSSGLTPSTRAALSL